LLASRRWIVAKADGANISTGLGARLLGRVGAGAGCRLGLPGDHRGLLVLARLGQRSGELGQGACLPVWVGDGAG
jgi:hypothetical protein